MNWDSLFVWTEDGNDGYDVPLVWPAPRSMKFIYANGFKKWGLCTPDPTGTFIPTRHCRGQPFRILTHYSLEWPPPPQEDPTPQWLTILGMDSGNPA